MWELAREFVARAANSPDDIAVVDATGEHTVAEVVAAATGLAAQLDAATGGSPTVLVQADNTWRTLAAAIAVGLRGGLIAVFSRHATPSEFAVALDDIAPDVVIADRQSLSQWGVPEDRFCEEAVATAGWVMRWSRSPVSDIERWNGGIAIAMTSGSTGHPKCVVQSESAIRYACRCTIEAVGLEPGDPVAAFVPLSSVAAFCFGLYLPAVLAAPMVCMDGWKPATALQIVREHRVAWTMLVPTMALQLAVAPDAAGALTSLRAMTVGGGPMDAGALGRAEQTLGTTFLRVFGMSECLGHTTPLPADEPDVRLGRDGRPFPGTVVRAVDEQGAPLPPGRVGDAQVAGPSLFVGYARAGAPTPPELTADGFLPTGDLVEVAEDGTIRVMGRQKQIIIRGGRNIDINEVEAAIARIPTVSQVCVVPVPDELLGERAAALVVSTGAPVTLDEVTAHLGDVEFPKFKWPEFVFTIDDLPQNRVGKLSRPDAVDLATRLLAGADSHSY
ncbi:acyl-CoA synthetase (AMP-forming)/AMP-acid ligase II [Rhodococcus percolatus]|uniref:class I adenylate-forming enzyme family protein n=1 Tax=Rhodococcus opacus TaxID=37919 RepID=UPI0015FE334A|nr:class I adenylate-forming enzyme family protein [Rhodococcus opacus]MBA8958662.1 acyl-CoA synthetase (AMP-forming)/AMP-acid ligase II [Rhodococcus opacus]MBP2204227.1 acyl-CoA synthetase (AMP-forming)/AMP-acid ligase II [Rhodococcus opacus]